MLTSHCSAKRWLLATAHVILNHGQVTWATPELAPPLLTTTPHQREDGFALDRFNVHRCPTRRVFSGTELELVTRQATTPLGYRGRPKLAKHGLYCYENADDSRFLAVLINIFSNNLHICNSSMRVYVTELLLNGWTNFDESFCLFQSRIV
ncbi:uncharacterized protein TNCV_3188421 [Trichonephila clavipes]|nr:uncharacterized protein TNCV_3188421 [Trichonephila clavipes]